MHTHKINPNLKEHQDFLAQNRKDPITGDTISAGDEVVFCAGCKSVFLKDTWEYLGGQHCEQSNTLSELPSSSIINFAKKESIFYYSFLPKKGDENKSHIPSKVKHSEEWEYREGELANYDYVFYNTPLYYILMTFSVGMGVIFSFTNSTPFPFFISVAALFAIIFLGGQELKSVGKELNNIYSDFKDNVFYISRDGIGFSSSYGIKEYILNNCDIQSVYFHFSKAFFGSNYCVIYTKNDQRVKFDIQAITLEEGYRLLDALKTLNTNEKIDIKVKIVKDNLTYNTLERHVIEKNYKISIARK